LHFSQFRTYNSLRLYDFVSCRECRHNITANGLGIAEGGANYLPTLSLNLSLPTFGNTLLGDFYFLLFATQKKSLNPVASLK
jgi:hypothetical protein